MKRALIVSTFFLFLLFSWEIVARAQEHMIFILPPPSKVIAAIWSRPDRFLFHTRITVMEMVAGLLLAVSGALPTAYLMNSRRIFRTILQPLFLVIQCLPMFTLAPLMVLMLGWSKLAIIIPTTLMIFFPLTLSLYKGLRATPFAYRDFFRSNHATPWQTFCKLQLPWAVPHFFSGLRISAGIAGLGAVAGEWAGGQEGLGVFILESRRAADLDTTFAAIFCLTTVSLALYSLVVVLESFALSPRPRVLSTPTAAASSLVLMFGLLALPPEPSQVAHPHPTQLALDWLPNPNHVPLYFGIEMGFFEEENIDLKVIKVHDPADGLPFLTSEMVDLSLDYMPHAIRAYASGADIKIVGSLIAQPLNALIYRKDSSISSVSDLTGKTIGYATSTLNHMTLTSILRRNNVTSAELKKVSFDLSSSLGSGLVDAVYGVYWNIEGVQLLHKGIDIDHVPLSTLGIPNYHELVVLVKGEADPDFVARVQRALQRSIDEAIANPDLAFAHYSHANSDKGKDSLIWEKDAWLATAPLYARSQEIDLEEVQAFYLWMRNEAQRVGMQLNEVEIGALIAERENSPVEPL